MCVGVYIIGGHKMHTSLIRIMRLIRGWSQSEFAKRLGIDRTTLSRVQTGFVKPGPDLRRRITEALHIPEDVLFGEDEGAEV
jgi:transcriptional regulator with XRE-family HTH domain